MDCINVAQDRNQWRVREGAGNLLPSCGAHLLKKGLCSLLYKAGDVSRESLLAGRFIHGEEVNSHRSLRSYC
jgi:hypothetical protein